MVNPVPGYGITTAYKKRGSMWSLGWHTGADISGAGVDGKPIVSGTPGRVIAANAYDRSYGYKVIIRWGNYDVWYCHMPKDAAVVRVGQTVTAGQRIGKVGSTGNVTGPHLHLELRVAGGGFDADNFRDPSAVINYKAPASVKVAPENVEYEVIADPSLLGRAAPVNGEIETVAAKGAKITSIGYTAKQSDGQVWVKNTQGLFFSKKFLKVKPKPPRTTLRLATYNIPADDKIPNEDARIARAVAVLAPDNLDVIGINEGQPRKQAGVPSAFMAKLHKALGGDTKWGLVIPTMAANENYILFRRATVGHVRQHEDVILAAGSGNRHLTRDVLRYLPTGLIFGYGVMHLVERKTPDNGADRSSQGQQAANAMVRMSQEHRGIPWFGVGDMNRAANLPGMTAVGQVNSRDKAAKLTNTGFATYTKYSAKVPSKNVDTWVIDHIYGPGDWSYQNHINRLDTDGAGKFRQPRPSDHCPQITVCTSP